MSKPKIITVTIPEAHWNLLVLLSASYHGNFKKAAGEWYSSDSVIMKLTEEEHNTLNELFN